MIVDLVTRIAACHDLPDPLPASPMALLAEWFEDARQSKRYDDFNAMTLATSTPEGRPSARVVLCKMVEPERPAIVFYTNYESRKGRELDANPYAAAVLHWPHAQRQVRVEGRVVRTSAEESDSYFYSRSLISRIGANASPQSRAIQSRQSVISEALRLAKRAAMGETITRPAYWGGFRILPERVELWSGQSGRLHDRAVWERTDEISATAIGGATWKAQRLGS